MREPGAVVLLALVITAVIRAFWVEILQILLFLVLLVVVTGVIGFVNLIAQARA